MLSDGDVIGGDAVLRPQNGFPCSVHTNVTSLEGRDWDFDVHVVDSLSPSIWIKGCRA